MRLQECISCEHVESFHVGVGGPAFIQCRVEPPTKGLDESSCGSRVVDIMTREVISVRAAMPVERLMLLLVDENIGGVPVVDEAGRPVGAVSKTDVLAELGERSEDSVSVPESSEATEQPPDRSTRRRTAGDLMTHPLLTIGASASVSQAAALMAARRVHRLGVADAEGRLLGMVTMTDIVRWVASR